MAELLDMEPRVAVLKAEGTNCDQETIAAFEAVGAEARLLLTSEFGSGEVDLARDFEIVVIPGGFSHGDDIKSGAVMALEIEKRLGDQVEASLEKGSAWLLICNGFQVGVRSGLLPGGSIRDKQTSVTLTDNVSGVFHDRWVPMRAEKGNKSLFVPDDFEERFRMPVAHAEGRFLTIDEATLDELEQNGQVVFRFVDKDGNPTEDPQYNPNGSPRGVTAICDPTGQILGMMPHPERFMKYYDEPNWRRFENPEEEIVPVGRMLIQNMVTFVKEA